MHPFRQILVAAAFVLPTFAQADVAPAPEDPAPTFDGSCICELACSGTALTYYQIQFSTTREVGTTDAGTADLACEDEAKELRDLKTLKMSVTARQATFHLCKFGGKEVAACSVDGACSEDKVSCFNGNLERALP